MDANSVACSDGRKDSWLVGVNWWWMLLGPLAIAVAIVHSLLAPEHFQRLQVTLEIPAPYLVGFVGLIYAIRFIRTRNPLFILMTVLALTLMLREFHFEWRTAESHFDWTGKGLYVALAALGVWAVRWRNRLIEPLRDSKHTSWIIATFWVYFLSQLIARRAFRGIPGEHEIHRSLEEYIEMAGHLMLIITSLVGSWRTSKVGEPKPAPEA